MEPELERAVRLEYEEAEREQTIFGRVNVWEEKGKFFIQVEDYDGYASTSSRITKTLYLALSHFNDEMEADCPTDPEIVALRIHIKEAEEAAHLERKERERREQVAWEDEIVPSGETRKVRQNRLDKGRQDRLTKLRVAGILDENNRLSPKA